MTGNRERREDSPSTRANPGIGSRIPAPQHVTRLVRPTESRRAAVAPRVAHPALASAARRRAAYVDRAGPRGSTRAGVSSGHWTARPAGTPRQSVSGPDRAVPDRARWHIRRVEPARRARLRPGRPPHEPGASNQRPAHVEGHRRLLRRYDPGVRLVRPPRHGAGDGHWRGGRRAFRVRRGRPPRTVGSGSGAPAHSAGGDGRHRRTRAVRFCARAAPASRRRAVLRRRAAPACGHHRDVRGAVRGDVRATWSRARSTRSSPASPRAGRGSSTRPTASIRSATTGWPSPRRWPPCP